MTGKFYAQATDPYQYDRDDIRWHIEGAADSPVRSELKRQLDKYLKDLNGKTVLDVGSGTGWLSEILYKHGAKKVVGIEPSNKNIKYSKEHYPTLDLHEGTVESFKTDDKFDLIIAILVLEHVSNVEVLFTKFKGLTKPNGQLLILLGDPDMLSEIRPDRTIDVEEHQGGLRVVKRYNKRYGTMYDLLRPIPYYTDKLTSSGFSITTHDMLDGLNIKNIFHLLVAQA